VGLEILYPIAGLIVGIIVGLTGVGGGSLMTPMLIFVFGVPPAIGVGTDLLFASITKTAGTVAHRSKDNIDWKLFRLLAAGSLPAAVIALLFLSTLDGASSLDGFILPVLGLALLATGLALIRWPFHENSAKPMSWEVRQRLTVLLGVAIGFLVTVTSIGAGAIGLAALRAIYPEMRSARAVGTDIAHAIPLAALAGLGHMQLGTVSYGLLVALLVGSIPGIWLGSMVGSRLPEATMRRILACVLMAVGLACIF
jgi:uncharacterized membrane protein YfcA